MTKTFLALAATVTGLGISAPASAQAGAVRTAHSAYTQGDFARAEHVLKAEQRVFPNRPEVLVNLAAVYARTGRMQQAAALYRQILDGKDIALDVSADRTASSHAIARSGLQRVSGLQTAAR